MKRILQSVAAMLLMFAVISCANIVSPSGGPKDTSPPEVITGIPESGAVNFSGHSFTLQFDEYVQLGNLQQQMLISPPLAEMPKFRLRGKSLTVSFPDTLLPATTYAFFFGDAIKDITENNPMVSYTYFFSTGDFIDSLELRGKVLNALDQKMEENVFVLLYTDPVSDSAFSREIPRYVTRPDKSGNFVFRHLAEGSYHLVAVADLNNNMLYDLITEPVAFHPEPTTPRFLAKSVADTAMGTMLPDSVSMAVDSTRAPVVLPPTPSVPDHALYMFKGEDSIQRITASRSDSRYKVLISYRYPLKDAEVLIADPGLRDISGVEWSSQKDTMWVWLQEHTSDTLPVIIRHASSTDTLFIPLRQPVLGGRGRQLDPRVGISMDVPRTEKIHPSRKPEVFFSIPLLSFDTKDAVLISETDTVPLILTTGDSLLKKRFTLKNPLVANMNYRMVIPEKACKGWDGTFNDSVDWAFSVDVPENFGTLKVTVSTDSVYQGGLLLLLLDEKSAILEERPIVSGETETFYPLKPSRYFLKVIKDINQNGRWDTGDYWRRLQPERVLSLANPVNIRANWEEEVEWIITPGP
ncbi:MAG: Ig-like domain-containing protein [Bacteroidales bacterium]